MEFSKLIKEVIGLNKSISDALTLIDFINGECPMAFTRELLKDFDFDERFFIFKEEFNFFIPTKDFLMFAMAVDTHKDFDKKQKIVI